MRSASNKSSWILLSISLIDWVVLDISLVISAFFGWWPMQPLTDFSVIDDLLLANVAYLIARVYQPITLHHRMVSPATVMKNAFKTTLLYILVYDALLGMTHAFVPGFFRSMTVFAIAFLCLTIERMFLRKILHYIRKSGHNISRAVLVGHGVMMESVKAEMKDGWNGYEIVGEFGNTVKDGVMPLENLLPFIQNRQTDELFLSMVEKYDDNWLNQLLTECEQQVVRVYYVPESYSSKERHTVPMEFGNAYVLAQYNEPLMNVMNRIKKRVFDLVITIPFLCLVFPFVYLIVALVTKITMPGPVFFKQKRTGYDGKDFWVYKFRSMKMNADADNLQATKGDPRVPQWGKILRHANIDELPQFINVLKGEMSVVGPRPHMLAHTEYYSARIGDYMVRHYVKPGITGWAQTHGLRGETKTVDDMARRVEMDIWYIEHWSMWLDVTIILKTIRDVLKGDDNAY